MEDIELTDEQTERQDLVDGAIFKLLSELAPRKVWDFERELVSTVRDAIIEALDMDDDEEMDFYPWVSED